jgi:hypothetical protein
MFAAAMLSKMMLQRRRHDWLRPIGGLFEQGLKGTWRVDLSPQHCQAFQQ